MTVGMYVGSFAKATATGNQDITLPTGCPDLTAAAAGSWAIKFFSTTFNTAGSSGTWTAHLAAMVGFTTGASNSYSVSAAAFDAGATSNSGRRMAAKCITITDLSGTASDECDFVSFPTSTTMRLNWTSQVTGAGAVQVMFIVFTGLTNAKVVNWTTATAAGTKAVTGVGFRPDLVLHAGHGGTLGSSAEAYFQFGAMNKHGQQWANAFASADAQVGASNTSRWQQTDACLAIVVPGESVYNQAHFVSMDSDGFTTYFTSSGSALGVISLCMGGVSSKLGAFTTVGTSTVVDSRHGFTPKGLLLSTISAAPASAPAAHAVWSLGGTDLTNQRAVSLADQDAQVTTSAKSVWWSNKVLDISTSAGVTSKSITYSSSSTSSFTLAESTSSSGHEILYLLVGDSGTDTFPQRVDHTLDFGIVSTATAHSNQKKAATLSTGTLLVIENGSSGSGPYGYISTKPVGGAWSYMGDLSGGFIAGWSNGSIASYVDSGGTERLVAVWKQSGTGGGRSAGATYLNVGTFNTGRTTLTWDTARVVDEGVGSLIADYCDVVAHAEGAGGMAHVVRSNNSGSGNNYAEYYRWSITSAGVITSPKEVASTLGGGYGVNIDTFPSIDIDPATKRLFVFWSAGTTGTGKGMRFRTAAYSAGPTWSWATEVEVFTDRYANDQAVRWSMCRWDVTSSKIIVGGWFTNGSNSALRFYESSSFTSFGTAIIDTVASSADRLAGGSFAIDPQSNIHVFGAAYSPSPFTLAYCKYTRATSTLGSIIYLDGGVGDAGGVNAWYSGGAVRWIYTAGNNAPYAVKYDQLLVSFSQTLSPSAIASSFASGAVTLAKTITLSPSGRATSFATGTPNLVNLGVISPSGIASQFAAGTLAIVTGPVTLSPSAIASSASLGSPNAAQNQVVEPAAIGSSSLVGEPSLHTLVQLLATSIASSFQAGGLTLTVGEVRLLVSAILSSFGVGIPFVAPPSEFYDAAAYDEDDTTIANERLIVVRQPFLKLIET